MFCKLLKIHLLPWMNEVSVTVFTWLAALNCNLMLISSFLYTYCVDMKLQSAPVHKKENRRCSCNMQQNPHPPYNFPSICESLTSLPYCNIPNIGIFVQISFWFYILAGNHPETSSWHCWGVIQRATQPQPDPHSSQHSRSHRHDGSQLLQQPARSQCVRNLASQWPR